MEKKILICGHRSFVATGLINKFKTAGIDFDCFSRGKEERNGNVVTGDVFLMHQNSELSENYDIVVNYILLKGVLRRIFNIVNLSYNFVKISM